MHVTNTFLERYHDRLVAFSYSASFKKGFPFASSIYSDAKGTPSPGLVFAFSYPESFRPRRPLPYRTTDMTDDHNLLLDLQPIFANLYGIVTSAD